MWIQWRKAGSISPKFRNKTRTSTHTTWIQHNTGIPSHSHQTTKRSKIKLDWRGRSKTVTTDWWHSIIYGKDATKKWQFGQIIRYEFNIQKSILFLYINNKIPEREIKGMIPFTITSKRMKYLRINLPKIVKDLYLENYGKLGKLFTDEWN